MMGRTDLAVECVGSEAALGGITQELRGRTFHITEITISDEASGKAIGKPRGHYLTLEATPLSRSRPDYREMVVEFGEELRKYLPKSGDILVVGLGNAAITPDALGPKTAAHVLATRHLKSETVPVFLQELRQVSVLSAGVMGQTGMESAELTAAICEKIKPVAVLAVDAFACSAWERLGTTIQVCDSGLQPGSGVSNSRQELSEGTLGIPVIAMGVPTVMDMRCAASEPNMPPMMVTPRDIDRLIDHTADLLSCAINLALHPTLDFETIQALEL